MYNITLKNCDSKTTLSMREEAKRKFSFLEKLIKDGTEIHINAEKFNGHSVQLKLYCTLKTNYHCDIKIIADDYYSGLDLLKESTKAVISKHNERRERKEKLNHTCINQLTYEDFDHVSVEITKRKSFVVTCVSEEQAIEHMELLGHSFFVFNNSDDNDKLSILYLKKDSSYGIITLDNDRLTD